MTPEEKNNMSAVSDIIANLERENAVLKRFVDLALELGGFRSCPVDEGQMQDCPCPDFESGKCVERGSRARIPDCPEPRRFGFGQIDCWRRCLFDKAREEIADHSVDATDKVADGESDD